MKTLLKHGCLAGLAGGLAMALFMVTFGRGPINDAIALEDAASAAADDDHLHADGAAAHTHEDLFSRGVQELGGFLGLMIFGLGVGLIFAVVLGATAHRLGARSSFGASVRLGLLGFLAVVVIPFVKLPANPPAVGNPDTINQRTLLYFAVLFASIAFTVLAVKVMQSGLGLVATGWATAGVFALALVTIFLVMPDNPDEVSISADLVWRFRLASLGSLASLWTIVALTMGSLMERAHGRDQDRGGATSAASL